MLSSLIFMIKILLPAMGANGIPVLLRHVYFFNVPICSKRFGKNKTRRGFFGAIVVGGIIMQFLVWIGIFSTVEIDLFFNLSKKIIGPFFQFRFVILGGLMGMGAILGDLIESFIKRRLGIVPGGGFFPWDQIDYILGFFIITRFFHSRLRWEPILYCVYGGLISFLAHNISYHMKLINTKR